VVRDLDDEMKVGPEWRARRHGRSTEKEVREILRNAIKDEGMPRKPLGSRLRERFAGIGLEDELPELPGGVAGPVTDRGVRRRWGRAGRA
jgi:plasmid stability protein